jgi:N-methylhydantoinase A
MERAHPAPAGQPDPAAWRAVRFSGRTLRTPVFTRAHLRPGHAFTGPLVIEQFDSTTVVPPGARASVDIHGIILIDLVEG